MKTFNLLLLFNLILFINAVKSQGCSDAGFCSLNGIQNSDSHHTTFKNQFTIGSSFGKADNNINIIAPYFSYQRAFNNKYSMGIKLTSISQINENVSSSGLSDAFITTNYQVSKTINLTAGAKLPLNDGNELHGNNSFSNPLPLDFQPSLGTTDLILGFATNIKKLQINMATQLPLTQTKNTFNPEIYDSTNYFFDFQNTNLLNRKGDVLLLSSTEKFHFSASLLSIYHLGEDTYTDINNIKQSIEESDGLTINLNLFLDYHISENSSVEFSVGSPIIVRKVRPDGLTRSFIASLGYNYQF